MAKNACPLNLWREVEEDKIEAALDFCYVRSPSVVVLVVLGTLQLWGCMATLLFRSHPWIQALSGAPSFPHGRSLRILASQLET